jgi:hypothetical protein
MRQVGLQFDVVTLIGFISGIYLAKDAAIGESLQSSFIGKEDAMQTFLLQIPLLPWTTTVVLLRHVSGSLTACLIGTVSYNVLMTGYSKNNLSEPDSAFISPNGQE